MQSALLSTASSSAGQDRDVGRSARPALCRSHRKLAPARAGAALRPEKLRRNYCAPDGADALPLPVRGELCEVCGLPGYGSDGRQSLGDADCSAAPCCCRRETRMAGPIPKGRVSCGRCGRGRCTGCWVSGIWETDVWPGAKVPIFSDLSYYMHDGGHGMVPSDWDVYLKFLRMHLQPEQ